MLKEEAKKKILAMSGKELFKYLQDRPDLTPTQRKEINMFWLSQRNLDVNRR
jgi:hypothetical protein